MADGWGRVERPDAEIWYLDTAGDGDGDLPVLVLLHGLAGYALEWGALIAALRTDHRVIAIEQDDRTALATRDVIARLASLGAAVHRAPATASGVPALLAPLCHAQTFYLGLPALAATRGLDADAPSHLTKVTETL